MQRLTNLTIKVITRNIGIEIYFEICKKLALKFKKKVPAKFIKKYPLDVKMYRK